MAQKISLPVVLAELKKAGYTAAVVTEVEKTITIYEQLVSQGQEPQAGISPPIFSLPGMAGPEYSSMFCDEWVGDNYGPTFRLSAEHKLNDLVGEKWRKRDPEVDLFTVMIFKYLQWIVNIVLESEQDSQQKLRKASFALAEVFKRVRHTR